MTKSFLPIAAITCGLLSCMASGVYGQMGTPTYSPGPEMIVGEIQHYVMGTEVEPYDRYSIGIGESVCLMISSFEDWDLMTMPDGSGGTSNPIPVQDEIGEVLWTLESGQGSLYPSVGSMAMYYATPRDMDELVDVKAKVKDSRQKGIDLPKEKHKSLTIKVPSGVNVIGFTDTTLPIVEAGADITGTGAIFVLQVTPTNVDFSKLWIQEKLPVANFNWPDNFADTNGAAERQVQLEITLTTTPGGLQLKLPNTFGDVVQTYRKASHLKDANTGNFIAFDWTQSQDLEYHLGQDAMGNNLWKKFATVKHKREYKATKEARMTCEASNTMSSNWAGAWRAKQGINVVVP